MGRADGSPLRFFEEKSTLQNMTLRRAQNVIISLRAVLPFLVALLGITAPEVM
jgi:hypothetical protein